jgi:hypothetical protein
MQRLVSEQYTAAPGGAAVLVRRVLEDVDATQAKADRADALRAEVWAYVDGVLDAREREALAALLQRATLTVTLGGSVDGEALSELVGVLAWADAALAVWPQLKARVEQATSWDELQAITFDSSALGPAPTVTASDIAAKLRGGG